VFDTWTGGGGASAAQEFGLCWRIRSAAAASPRAGIGGL